MSDTDEIVESLEVEGSEAESQVEYTETEQQAIEMGWKPEGIEGKRNLSAEEFVDRKELYNTVHSLKKTNKRLEEGMEALKKHQGHIAAKAREQAIAELKAEKKQALVNEDYDAVLEIDDKIASARSEPVEVDAPSNPAFNSWIEDNTWYNDDSEMRKYADKIGIGYAALNKDAPPEEVFNHVESEVKIRFKDKFENKRRGSPSPVEGASRGNKQVVKSKYSEADLPDEARQIMKTLVRSGVTTKEQYLTEYFA